MEHEAQSMRPMLRNMRHKEQESLRILKHAKRNESHREGIAARTARERMNSAVDVRTGVPAGDAAGADKATGEPGGCSTFWPCSSSRSSSCSSCICVAAGSSSGC